MLLKLENIQNKSLRRGLEHIFYILVVFILIPTFVYFEQCIVLPAIVEEFAIEFMVHLFCGYFILLNIVGNLIYGMFTNTSIKGRMVNNVSKLEWDFCAVCECYRPPRAWHCSTCDICILKRDHHCTFFACCVGYYNHRYFILFTFYVFIAMLYSFYLNVKFVSLFITWNHGLVLVKFIFPLASIVFDFSSETLYVLMVVVNFLIGCFTGFLFIYHFINLLKGRIVYEKNCNKKDVVYDRGWRSNMVEVFGSRWHLTWISPFISSPLPGNGVEWPSDDKQKWTKLNAF